MPRPQKCRCIHARPAATVFKPSGVPGRRLEEVELRLDELEAIRLADLEGLYHDGAAARMGISRATFGRVVEAARRKVADALLNGKMLAIKGGVVVMSDKRTFVCADCDHRFEVPYGAGRPGECPSCHGTNVGRAAEDRGPRSGGRGRGQCNRGRRRQRGRSTQPAE